MKRKNSLIVALAAFLMFLMPVASTAQIINLGDSENQRVTGDGGGIGIGWGPGAGVDDIETDQYVPVGNGLWVLAASAGLYLLVKSRKSRKAATLMFAALALTLGTAQCKKTTENVAEEETPAPKTIYINLMGGNGKDAKADINPYSGKITWNPNDKVYVVYNGELLSTDALTVTPNESNPVYGTIGGPIEVSTEILEDNPEFTFIYVGNGYAFSPAASVTSLTFTLGNQNGTDAGDYMVGRTEAIRMIKKGENSYSPDPSLFPEFKPLTSVLFLDTETNFGAGTITMGGSQTMNQMELALSDMTPTCSHTADITFQSSKAAQVSVMPTTTANVNADATLNFSGNTKIGTITVKDGIKAGRVYAHVFDNASHPFVVEVIETGMLSGEFSVNSSGGKVCFSKGNLQYQASANKWQFAANQYDYIGSDNANIGSSYSGWIDLFGWGATGYWDNRSQLNTDETPKYQKNYQAYSTSKSDISGGAGFNNYGYGPDYKIGETTYSYNLSVEHRSDWGYNAINAGDNLTSGWRTLTNDEWGYLFGNSTERNGKYKCGVTVCGKTNCVVVAPDQCLNGYTFDKTKTSYTSDDWVTAEEAGLVCLPAAGYREVTALSEVGSNGYYWSSTCYFGYAANHIKLSSSSVDFTSDNRYYGYSVRLVKDVTPLN